MERIKEISAFFPAYNEEGNIENTVLKANKVLEKMADKYEIIVVDDGSKDKTREIVRELSSKNNKIRLITHKKNSGYGSAVRSGFKNCKYEWIVFTASDGQFDFSELPNFISTQRKTGADLVIGYYRKRRVPFARKLNSAAWQFLIRVLLGLKVKDIDCGFKLIRKKVIDSMPLTSERGAFISTEFLVKAKQNNFKMVEIPITHYPRKEGQATGADFKVIINSFKDLYQLKKKGLSPVKRKFFLFCFVGITSTIISLIIFNLLLWLGLTFSLSFILALLGGIICNFLMNRNIAFSAKGFPVKKQMWRYGIVYLMTRSVNFFVGLIMVYLLGEGTLQANIAAMIGIAVGVPFSFLGSLLWAFKKETKRKHLNS